MRRSVFLLYMAAIACGFSAIASAQELKSVSQPMTLETCLELIRRTTLEGGAIPKTIMDTEDIRMVRFITADGSVLVTCSRPDQKVLITQSPFKGK